MRVLALVALVLLVALAAGSFWTIGRAQGERRARDAERLAKRGSLSGPYALPPGCSSGDMHVGAFMPRACVTEPNTLHHIEPVRPLTEPGLTWVRYGDNAVAVRCQDMTGAGSPYRTGCLIRGYMQNGFGPDAVAPGRGRLILE
jgi:hypothetical protein